MVIDTHCHILPGVDDGSRNAATTKRMLEMAFREGISGIIATPHYEYGMDKDVLNRRKRIFEAVQQISGEMNPGFQMFLGNEIFFSDNVISALENGTALTLNGTRYVLVEFPVYADFSYISRAVRNLRYAGFFPILAHIERYEGTKKIEQIRELVDMGAYMQVNASTVTGKMGWLMKKYVLNLMRSDLIHLLGTDAHGCEHRRPEMRECLKYLNKKIGIHKTKIICSTNPVKVIRGEEIRG